MANKSVINSHDFHFEAPTCIAIFGPTMSGKTLFTANILKNVDQIFSKRVKKVVYCYNEFLPMLGNIQKEINIPFITHEGLPDRDDLEKWSNGEHFLIVMDDLQQACERTPSAADLFTVGSHHLNYSLIYICHNIFNRGTISRTISLNCHYLVLFRNNRDKLQIETLGRQIFGYKYRDYFTDAFDRATKNAYGYLLINNHPTVRDFNCRLMTNVLPNEVTTVYIPKRKK